MRKDLRARRASQRAALLGVLLLLAFASHARAVPGTEPIPSPTLVSTRIPSNGALLMLDSRDVDLWLRVVGIFGETIDGTYVQVAESYWAWRPTAALWPGTYELQSTSGPPNHEPNGLFWSSFTVVDSVDLSRPVLNSTPSVSLVTQTLDTVCCDLWTDNGIEVGGCAATTELSTAVLEPGLSSATGAVALGQFVFALAPPDTAATGFAPWSAPKWLDIATQADEYCYAIEAMSIVDLTVHKYDDLTPRCAPHGALGAIGSKVLELPEEFFDRARCTEPPDGFEAEWCEHNADCEGSLESQCIMFEHICKGGERPSWSLPGAGAGGGGGTGGFGASGSGGMGGSGGGGSGGHDQPSGTGGASGAADTATSGGSGGTSSGGASGSGGEIATVAKSGNPACSASHTGAATRSSVAALLLSLAIARLTRRRRARPRLC